MADPEQIARIKIDALLEQCGWAVQDKNAANLSAARGVALRELSFKTGEPDYTLFVDGKAIGTVEAKPEGHSLIGVEEQSEKYVKGVPFGLPAWRSPLPFSYETTGTRKFLAKQQCAMAEVERRLSVVEELDAVVNANLQGTTRLRQSILQRAFEESLVSSH
jgi:type I site-specific restriction endonuclease